MKPFPPVQESIIIVAAIRLLRNSNMAIIGTVDNTATRSSEVAKRDFVNHNCNLFLWDRETFYYMPSESNSYWNLSTLIFHVVIKLIMIAPWIQHPLYVNGSAATFYVFSLRNVLLKQTVMYVCQMCKLLRVSFLNEKQSNFVRISLDEPLAPQVMIF